MGSELTWSVIVLVTRPFIVFKWACLFGLRTACIFSITLTELLKATIYLHFSLLWRMFVSTIALLTLPLRLLTAIWRERQVRFSHSHSFFFQLHSYYFPFLWCKTSNFLWMLFCLKFTPTKRLCGFNFNLVVEFTMSGDFLDGICWECENNVPHWLDRESIMCSKGVGLLTLMGELFRMSPKTQQLILKRDRTACGSTLSWKNPLLREFSHL